MQRERKNEGKKEYICLDCRSIIYSVHIVELAIIISVIVIVLLSHVPVMPHKIIIKIVFCFIA